MRLPLRFLLLAILFAGLALAQDPDAVPVGPDEIPVYLPGGDQAGPTLPSQRGIGPVFSRENLARIRPYIGVNMIHDSGLTPVSTDEDGNLIRRGSYGGSLNFGAVGSRAFRHSLLNLSYSGSIRHYPRNKYFTGTNHMLRLGFNHMFSRRLSLNSTNRAGIRSNAFMSDFGNSLLETDADEEAGDDIFNNPVIYASTMQQLVYQKSARLSLFGGGGGYLQQRRSNALVSARGAIASGGVGYRLDARKTLGVTYSFNQFFFSGGYGGSNVHNLSVEYGQQLTRRTSFSLSVGGARIESQALRAVRLDPIIAALLGQTMGIEATYRKNYLPTFGADLTHNRGASQVRLFGVRRINSGNGVMLTSARTAFGASYGYTGFRRWTFRAATFYSQYQGLLGTARQYKNYRGSVGFTYRIAEGLSWTGGVSARRLMLDESNPTNNPWFARNQYRVTTGLRWTPGDMPVPFF